MLCVIVIFQRELTATLQPVKLGRIRVFRTTELQLAFGLAPAGRMLRFLHGSDSKGIVNRGHHHRHEQPKGSTYIADQNVR